MADEASDIDSVIATLEAKVASLQEAVLALRKAKDALGGSVVLTPGRGTLTVSHDTFTGLTILQASERYLRMVGRPARTTDEITEALSRGGVKATPASVATTMIRSHNADGPVVRVQKGVFGLADWYPKRPPRTKGAKGGNGSAEEGAAVAESETTSDE